MLTEELHRAIKINALNAIQNPDYDAFLRRIFRWYSKTFHTSLPEVEEIPIVEVLTSYYEEVYEKMEDSDIKQEKIKLLMSPEEWAKKLQQEEVEDLAFIEAIKSKKKVEGVKVPVSDKPELPSPPEEEGFAMSFEDVPI